MTSTPVALLHGLGGSTTRTWGEPGWIDILAESGRAVIGLDLLGHGRSPKPHDPAAYGEMEARVEAELPTGPIDAIGFSLGAQVLLQIATRSPGRFRRLVLAGVGANLFLDEDREPLARAIEQGEMSDPFVRYLLTQATADSGDPMAIVACLRRPGPPSLRDEDLANVTCPVLVVLGDRDFVGPADPLLLRLPNAHFLPLAGVDHFATPKQFDFIDGALEFLDSDLDGRGRGAA